MKRVLILIAAVAVMAAFFSCNKEDILDNNVDTTGVYGSGDSGPVKAFVATTEPVSVNGKISLGGTLPQWCDGDAISVYDAAGAHAVYTLTSGTGTANGVFSCSSSAVRATPYSAVYPADIRTAQSQIALPAIQQSTDGSLRQLPMYAVGNTKDIKFFHLCGVLCIRLSATSPVSLASITVATSQNINGEATISGSDTSVSLSTPSGSSTTMLSIAEPQNITSERSFYMYLPAGDYASLDITLSTSAGDTCIKNAATAIRIKRGEMTTLSLGRLEIGELAPEGAAVGLFSLSESERTYFSQGNLHYQASTGIWRFADYQYDIIGTFNHYASSTYCGWIDYFGWGTSGWNNGNYWYMPYDKSCADQEPYSSARGYGYGPTDGYTYTYNLTGNYANADWGVYNAIENGGNEAGLWRTPTRVEWQYVFDQRTASTIDTTPNARFAMARVSSIGGVILFPDVYSHPAGLKLPVNINNGNASMDDNNYSAFEWESMEAAGAVFLPAAGQRGHTSLCGIGYDGHYWSSTNNNSPAWAEALEFGNGGLRAWGSGQRFNGKSVRLVYAGKAGKNGR